MCGVAGFVAIDHPRPRDWLGRLGRVMTAGLAHRGPDQSGVSIDPDGRVMLAATRLAVRDRTPRGDQPRSSPEGEVTLVFNGELYRNRGHHRARWPARGPGDTEQFLGVVHDAADPDEPGRGLAPLDAMFGAAWHDRRLGRVVLARDHFGVKPLVWTRAAGGLLFASEVTTLLATGLVEAVVDPGEFLRRSYVRMDAADDGTWLAGIHSVEPAHTLAVEADGAVRIAPYWSVRPHEGTVGVDEVAAAFTDAVRIRRPAEVPLAAVVSGGVDSSAIYTALRREGVPVTPHVVRYEGAGAEQNEDLPYAREVTAALGEEPVQCEVRVDDLPALTPRLVRRLQRPFLHGAEIAMMRTYAGIAAGSGVVCFSGHGADEMWGYQDGRYFPVVDPARPPHTHGAHYLRHRLYRDERPVWHGMLDRLTQHLDHTEEEVTEGVWERTLRAYREVESLDPTVRGRHHLLRRFLVYVNEMVDATSTTFSLEDRPVFQDVTLAGLAFGMPEHVKNTTGIGQAKPFLTAALAGWLPRSVRERRKKGFPYPDDPAFRTELRTVVRERGLPFDVPFDDGELARLGTGELMFLYSARCWLDALSEPCDGPGHADTSPLLEQETAR